MKGAEANGGVEAVTAAGRARARRSRSGASCEKCYFGCRGLCALNLGGPCSTFRPDRPEGLVPPRQPELLIREPAFEPAAV